MGLGKGAGESARPWLVWFSAGLLFQLSKTLDVSSSGVEATIDEVIVEPPHCFVLFSGFIYFVVMLLSSTLFVSVSSAPLLLPSSPQWLLGPE